MSCSHCSEDAKFVGYRVCRPTCLFGKIVYERAYYYCRHCKSGWFPTDAEFGIKAHQTSGAREVISLLLRSGAVRAECSTGFAAVDRAFRLGLNGAADHGIGG